MTEKLDTIFTHDREDGGRLTLSVGPNNHLYVNGEPVVTESKLTLNWWVQVAVVLTGASTMALAVVEIGRVTGLWTSCAT